MKASVISCLAALSLTACSADSSPEETMGATDTPMGSSGSDASETNPSGSSTTSDSTTSGSTTSTTTTDATDGVTTDPPDESSGSDSSGGDSSSESSDTAVGCEYPAGAVEPMAIGEVLSPYSWGRALHNDGTEAVLDLNDAPCGNDGDIAWSPHDVLVFVSIPAW